MGAVRDLNSTRGSFSGLIVRRRGETERIAWDKLRAGSVWEGTFSWVMWDAKYFARAALLTGSEVRLTVTGPAEERLTSATLAIAALPRVITGAEASFEFSVFGGAKDIDVLRRLGGDLDEAIDLGWTAFLARPLLTMLKLFHQWLGNYGWAIVLLTLLIKVALYPLTASSMRSMQKLAKLKPKIEELQKKFREDRARLNQEMMSLYQQEKVNPMGGCLPMILQIPIFFALYNVLLVSIELRHAPFFGWVTDLSAPDTLVTVHLLGHEIPIRVLVLIMGGTMWLQQKLSPSTMDPAQQKIFMIMPIVFTALFYSFPSGLVVYWLTNNIVSIVQQWWIMRPNTST
jgi:YidC/Oxa1 family membrane protein insertase